MPRLIMKLRHALGMADYHPQPLTTPEEKEAVLRRLGEQRISLAIMDVQVDVKRASKGRGAQR